VGGKKKVPHVALHVSERLSFIYLTLEESLDTGIWQMSVITTSLVGQMVVFIHPIAKRERIMANAKKVLIVIKNFLFVNNGCEKNVPRGS
jgi:hypothetical protein